MDAIAKLLADGPLPAAAVDLDAFEANVDLVAAAVRRAGKRLRLASKSIRSVALLARARDRAGDVVRGVMTYAAAETELLARAGFRDLVLAYPTVLPADAAELAAANAAGALAAATVDDADQLPPLAAAARDAGTRIPVVIDVDMSLRSAGGLHLGVRRSPLHAAAPVVELAARIASDPALRFHGVMGYEAQIAGLPDRSPGHFPSPSSFLLKRFSRPAVAALRAAVVAALGARGLAPTIVNGGGSGSLESTGADPAVDEITAGSAFLAVHLFDRYLGLDLRPSLVFALQVARRPAPGIVTCHGGGYVASGAAGPDRLPLPVWPPGARLLPLEGAGEVQTPVRLPPGVELGLGDVVLFRHAKSGELAEHFPEYRLVRNGRVEERVATYRGDGRCFLG